MLDWVYNKPLQAFWQPENLTEDGTADPQVDMAVAASLIRWNDPLMASGYGETVSRLLHCDFDVDDALLDTAELRRAVSTAVVGPLQRAMENMNDAGQVARRHYQQPSSTAGWSV